MQNDNQLIDDQQPASQQSELDEIRSLIVQISQKLNLQNFGSRKPFNELGSSAIEKKVKEVRKVFSLFYTFCAPGFEDDLKSLVEEAHKKSPLDHVATEFLKSVIERVKEVYLEATTSRGRLIALSLVSNRVDYNIIIYFIPSVSRSMFYRSRQLDIFVDTVISNPLLRERYDRDKVKFFIQFVIRFDIMGDLPHGVQKVELSNGQTLELNEMLKKHINSHIVQLYEQYLERLQMFESMKMSRSTYFKVINAIPHRKTTAASCVDYFYSRAEYGFDAICEIIEKLETSSNVDQEELKQLKIEVKEGRIFSNGEFRTSIESDSTIFDFSATFGLSDPNDNDFKARPMTNPTHRSEKSVKLEVTLLKVQRLFEANINDSSIFDPNEREIYKNLLDTSLLAIYELKRHYIRSFYTAFTKIAILNDLKPGQALVTMDFAQKYLPQNYLEEQSVSSYF